METMILNGVGMLVRKHMRGNTESNEFSQKIKQISIKPIEEISYLNKERIQKIKEHFSSLEVEI